ncbi:hypothetical protein [Streptomyces sp. NPDC088775]|uniref:hypothetical protein n=1 Tax=Streptomyces sp. NPDC088775 TaxID=3365896 RepID=UPI00380EA254
MADIPAERIGLETGTYLLPCGCKIYVYFPGGYIHFEGNATTKCPELYRLWTEYWASCRTGQNWDSHTRYIKCLRHVGAGEACINKIKYLRSTYAYQVKRDDTQQKVQHAEV